MADALQQIKRDLDALATAIATLAEKFDSAYDTYLGTLRASMHKQVVLACYHLCTHGYPESFLALSFRQRETLQQAIQAHIAQTQTRLISAYALATIPLQNEDDERSRKRKRRQKRRSLTVLDRAVDRHRRSSSPSPTGPDDDDDGPSIELIAIGDMDDDDMLAIAKDPMLAAALNEIADQIPIDDDTIVDRIKAELIRKVSASQEERGESQSEDHHTEDHHTEDDPLADDQVTDNPVTGNPVTDSHGDAGTDNGGATREGGSLREQAAPTPTPHGSDPSIQQGVETVIVASDDHAQANANAIGNSSSQTSPTKDGVTADVSAPTPSHPLDNIVPQPFSWHDDALTPVVLSQRHKQLEKNLSTVLAELSTNINRTLRQAGVMPNTVPDAVLNAAVDVDVTADGPSDHPNVLSIVVDAEEEDASPSRTLRLMALRVRIPELEFNDSLLAACRTRIQGARSQLRKIGKSYDSKLQAKAIAEAELAWRASWYEQSD